MLRYNPRHADSLTEITILALGASQVDFFAVLKLAFLWKNQMRKIAAAFALRPPKLCFRFNYSWNVTSTRTYFNSIFTTAVCKFSVVSVRE